MPNILLIDDDDALRRMLRLTLSDMGHTVIEAVDGRAALRLHAAYPIDLVLTDIIMPEKEGLETIMEMCRTPGHAPIIAMSGGGRMSAIDYLLLAQQFGARCVLEKPFSNSELAMAIETALGSLPAKQG